MKRHQVIFQPSGRRGAVPEGLTLLEAARLLGVGIESACGGLQSCGKCRVRIEPAAAGSRGDAAASLSAFGAEEARFIPPPEREAGYRLACRARVQGGVTVFVPEESRAVRQVVRKEASDRTITLNPAVRLFPLLVPEPTLADPEGDLDRLVAALAERHGIIARPSIEPAALQSLPEVLRQANGSVTAVLWMERIILAVFPGSSVSAYGLAVDIGSTTVAGYLCDLTSGAVVATHSLMNPQVAFGEDVISRIAYANDHPGEGLARLHGSIIEALNRLLREACGKAGIAPSDLYELTLVGNTAMHHFALGIDPRALGVSPFAPAVRHPLDLKARDLGLASHPAANVHVLPIEAGFVGADNVAVLIAETPYRQSETILIIDVGTNGEMVLGNQDRLMACSCATGPALEGAHIRFGMRAAEGAIERIRIDPATLEPSFKLIGRPEWSSESPLGGARGICGSGIIDGVAELHRVGLIDAGGRFQRHGETQRLRVQDGRSEYVVAWRHESALGEEITIGQQDVRSVQLAKAALYAGAKLMMKRFGIGAPDRVVLAGAFGSTIDKTAAMRLGMFPDCAPARVFSVGNAAGDGARIALLDRDKRREAEAVACSVEYLELSGVADFQEEFLAALAIPHERDPFPHLPPSSFTT